MPILESMACGTPVIASHTSSLPEVGGNAALYVDPYNPSDIAAVLEQLISSPDLYKQLQEKSLAQAKKFTWHKTAEETLRVFETVFKR